MTDTAILLAINSVKFLGEQLIDCQGYLDSPNLKKCELDEYRELETLLLYELSTAQARLKLLKEILQ